MTVDEIKRLQAALSACVQFADQVAAELDIDMSETVVVVRVMPGGREAAARSWQDVQDEARRALALVG